MTDTTTATNTNTDTQPDADTATSPTTSPTTSRGDTSDADRTDPSPADPAAADDATPADATPADATPADATPADGTKADAPKPLFTDFGVDDDLAEALRGRGIVHPFAIQELSLPLGIKGHDIIGQARTGTGKTLGFGLPLLQRIDADRAVTQALVIVPTRELCIQVADDLTIGAGRGITSIAVYGGVGYDEQIAALTSGVHVVVGTPGRTLDHLGRGNLDVSNVHTVVLDEADEMLDMGFLPDVEKLLADVPTTRQTLLFSATMPTAIVKLARRFMDKPTFMRANDTLHETAPTVEQHFFLVHRMDKPRVLARLLQQPGRGGAFVFCRTKRMCDRLVRELEPLGVSAISVHGDLRQSTREKNLDRFRAGKADVLVATEVAARGLDVSNVTHVVNYDCPDDEKMYLHRIGRTARAGESGVAVTFAEFNEVDRVNVIRKRVGVTAELAEVFSTSDELTERFDLPETTPWDDLGRGDDRGSSQPSRGGTSSRGSRSSERSSRRTVRGADDPARARSTASSSGSNRSSRRGSDRQDRSSDDRVRKDDRGRGGRQRRRGEAHNASSSTDRHTDRDRSGEEAAGGRERDTSRTRTRSRSRDSDANSRDRDANSRDSDANGRDRRDRQDSRDGDRTPAAKGRDGSSGRTSGGARKRARRNRGSRSGSATQDRSSGRSRSRGSDRDDSREQANRQRGDRRGSNRDGRTNAPAGGSTSKDSNRSGSGRSSSTRGRGDRGTSSTTTTSRGSEARGNGTPRLDRRVDVEHLP